MSLASILGVARAVIGMVHLRPLPGSPRWNGSLREVLEAAVADARALHEGGVDALIVENIGDAPFSPGRVDPACVAAIAVAVAEVRRAAPLPVGVNVLKTDACSALGVAAATGARFIRVNVHTGAVVSDQGLLAAGAHDTLRYRRLLGLDIRILADVHVKHGAPLAPLPIEQEARDCVSRGLADALVVSGATTGAPTAHEDLRRVRAAVPGTPVLVGSGASPESAPALLAIADGLIVGTALKRDGVLDNPVDPARVRRLVAAARQAAR